MLLEVMNHLIAWITIGAEEGVVVADTVYALLNLILAEPGPPVFRRKSLNSKLFSPDILLNLTTRTPLGIDLGSCHCNEIVPEEINGSMLFQDCERCEVLMRQL